MAESRYRRQSDDDEDGVAEAYARRLTSARTIRVLPDFDDTVPFRWGSTPLTGDFSGQALLSSARARGGGGGGGDYGRRRRRGLFSTPMTGGRSASRTPLADISHVVRVGDAQLEDEDSFVTPKPKSKTVVKPTTLGKVPNILTAIANDVEGGSDLTPQKKLLDSIEIVEKVVMEELDRLRRTPAARRAVREGKVKTLMSMR